ncbi:MAG: phage protein Gp27 family protein [Phaeobacter italicus]
MFPEHVQQRLKDELKARNFSDYDEVTELLNAWLCEEGIDETVGKTAVHSYGQDFQQLAEMQAQAQNEVRLFMEEASLKDEVDVTSALFQQLTTIQWRLQMTMANPEQLPDPRGLKDLTTALNNLIRSTSLRDGILAAERREQSAKLEEAVEAGQLDVQAAADARRIMGFA